MTPPSQRDRLVYDTGLVPSAGLSRPLMVKGSKCSAAPARYVLRTSPWHAIKVAEAAPKRSPGARVSSTVGTFVVWHDLREGFLFPSPRVGRRACTSSVVPKVGNSGRSLDDPKNPVVPKDVRNLKSQVVDSVGRIYQPTLIACKRTVPIWLHSTVRTAVDTLHHRTRSGRQMRVVGLRRYTQCPMMV